MGTVGSFCVLKLCPKCPKAYTMSNGRVNSCMSVSLKALKMESMWIFVVF